MKTKGFRCSLAFNKCRGSSSGSKAYLSVALIEPLESPLRALFGHLQRGLITVAATEPLETPLRALFGHPRRGLTTIAVIEPLESPLRALFGHPWRSLATIAVIEPLETPLRALFGHTQRVLTTVAVTEPLEDIVRSEKRRNKKNISKGAYTFLFTLFLMTWIVRHGSIYPVSNDFSRTGKTLDKKRWHPRAISL